MATINFSVPEEVKQAFNATFEGQNKSAVLTQMMREAIARAEEQRRREAAARRILSRHARAPQRSARALAKARATGRP
jgi:metal-responsive CopG/Arc/MetJ family transcriptional regulator